jgi:hypothetical protein
LTPVGGTGGARAWGALQVRPWSSEKRMYAWDDTVDCTVAGTDTGETAGKMVT